MPPTMARVEILRAACCIAGLDRTICEKERPMLQRLADFAGVGTVSLDAMMQRAERDQDFYKEQFKILKADPEATITSLFCVACADGDLTQDQRIILRHFADRLGLDEPRFNRILDAAEKKVHGSAPPRE